ncbi:DUF4290 domain-containing protein [Algivirga pacifica]|uniref:DUF4290 domain-containing protein n=1 Tax=Algivirga pacifica TaxID=1162670 RepID=A0ABP9CYU6_9BACT
MEKPSYNTERPELKLKEYGRNVQKLVEYISEIEDKEKRNRYANTLIGLMKQLNPSVNSNDTNQRIWDHLHVMADFKLEVDSPYPVPEMDVMYRKPDRMEYRDHKMRFRHYGRNIEKLIQVAKDEEDEELKLKAFANIMRLMKNFYQSWNGDNPDEVVIMKDIEKMAEGGVDMEKVLEKYPFLVDRRTYNDIMEKFLANKSRRLGK